MIKKVLMFNAYFFFCININDILLGLLLTYFLKSDYIKKTYRYYSCYMKIIFSKESLKKFWQKFSMRQKTLLTL